MTILNNKIGVIGLGNMGQPIAEHIANAGSEVFAYDIDTEKTATSNSLVVCNSIKEVKTTPRRSSLASQMLQPFPR